MTDQLTRQLLAELAEDAQEYLDLLKRTLEAPEGSEQQADLEGELYGLVAALKVHAEGVQEAIDAYTDTLPLEQEVA